MPPLYLLLLAAALSGATARHPIGHARSLLTASVPSPFSVPEMRTQRPGWRRLASMRALHNATHSPAHAHSFVGVTDIGFVDHRHTSWPRATTIFTDDYPELMAGATLVCEPTEPGAAPYTTAQGATVRNGLVMTLSLPLDASGALGVGHFVQAASAPGAAIIFDLQLLAEGSGFAEGTSCSAQVPHTATAYAIDDAASAGAGEGGTVLTLTLRPVQAQDVYQYLDVTLRWSPNATEELARRAAEGLPLGGVSRRRSLLTKTGTLADFRLNWDGTKAEKAAIEFVPSAAGLLTCQNCFAFLTAQYTFTLQFCLHFNTGASWWFTSDDYGGYLGGRSNAMTNANMADCLSAPWVTKPANFPESPATTTDSLNLFMNAEAFVTGTAGAAFLISSSGFSASGDTGGCKDATDSSTCTRQPIISPFTLPPIFLVAGGASVIVSGEVRGAAVYSGAVKGSMSFGASAAVTNAKLGGKLYFPNFGACFSTAGCADAISSALTAYTTFPMTYASTPFSIQLTSAPTANIDATLWVIVSFNVNSILPITASTAYRFSASIESGKKTLRRTLRYADAGPRHLDSAATCPASTGMTTINQKPSTTSLAMGPITLASLASALKISTSPPGSYNLVPLTSLPLATSGAEQPLIAACVPTGAAAFTGTAGGAGSKAVTSISGSGNGGAMSAGGANSGSDAPSPGVIAGAVIGALALTGLLAFAAWYYFSKPPERPLKAAAGGSTGAGTAAQRAALGKSPSLHREPADARGAAAPPPSLSHAYQLALHPPATWMEEDNDAASSRTLRTPPPTLTRSPLHSALARSSQQGDSPVQQATRALAKAQERVASLYAVADSAWSQLHTASAVLEAARAREEEDSWRGTLTAATAAAAASATAAAAAAAEATGVPAGTLRALTGTALARGADVAAVISQLTPAAFRLLRNKGAITTSGRPLQAVQLSPEEEDYIGTGMLIKLAQAGIILY